MPAAISREMQIAGRRPLPSLPAYRSGGRFAGTSKPSSVAHELSIVVAGFDGVVEIIEGFVAAACSSGQAGEVIPEPEHILSRASSVFSTAYLVNGVQVHLFRVFVSPSLDQSAVPRIQGSRACRGAADQGFVTGR